jgi:hypothetical protein
MATTIIASEIENGFNFCTTEFNGDIEDTGYSLYHYYDKDEKVSILTSKGNCRALWENENDIEVFDENKGFVPDYYDLLEYGNENKIEYIYTYINGEWMVTNKDLNNNYKPFVKLSKLFSGRPFYR